MAIKKTKAKNLDTLDITAKKKKNFLIVGVIIAIVTIFGVSIGSAFLNVDKKKLYQEKRKIANDKTLNVIQNPEYKENWAISIENRLEDQGKRLSEVVAELSAKQSKMLVEIKKELRDGNQKKSDEIAELGVSMDKKFAALSDKVQSQLDENDQKMEQIRIMADSMKNQVSSPENEIVVGPDLLPKQPTEVIVKDNGEVEKVPGDTGPKIDKKPEEVTHIELKKPDLKQMDTFKPDDSLTAEVTKSEKVAQKTYEKPQPDEVIKPKQANHKKNIQFVKIDTSFNESIVAEAIKLDEEVAVAKTEDEIKNGFHVSTGLTQVYMVTGAYAPAFSDSNSEPLPVLMESEGNILMPNDTYGSVNKCFLLGSAKGNMNSETADIRLVSISCLLDDGKYRIEGSINGWVIGENGIPGVPGELLHKNGAWIAKTFVSGFLETFSSALVASAGPKINLGGSTSNTGTTVGVSDAIGANALSAGAGGVSTVFNKLGDYYLKMAEQIFPVIEVKGGRNINVLLMGGEELSVVENNKADMSLMESYIEQQKMKKSSKNVKMSNNAFTKAISNGDTSGGMFVSDGEAPKEDSTSKIDDASLNEFDISE